MRKKFLINPGLQLKHLCWTLGFVAVCAGAGYFLVESWLSSSVSNGLVSAPQWLELRHSMRLGFLVLLAILMIAVGLENYLYFHRVAGPLYALEKGLRRLAQGDFNDVTKIRDGDEFGELIAAFEEMKKRIHERFSVEEQTAQLLSMELDRLLRDPSLINIEAIRKKLKSMRDQMEKKAA